MLGIGIAFAAAFVLLSAFREVSFTQALSTVNPALLLVCAFVPVSLGAYVWSAARGFRWPKGRAEMQHTFMLNVTTCLGWVATIYGLKKLNNPIAFSCIAFGFIYTFTLLYNALTGKSRPSFNQIVAACVIALGGCLASYRVLVSSDHSWTTAAVYGLILAFVASFFGAANNVISGQLSKGGIAPMRISSLRFLLVIFVEFVIFLFDRRDVASADVVARLSTLGFVGIGLPLVFIQFAIAGIGATRTSLVTASIPLAVSILQAAAVALGYVVARDSLWDVSTLAAILVSAGVFWGFYSAVPAPVAPQQPAPK